MARDVWLSDDEPGCLECGTLKFKESRVPGICTGCLASDTATSDPWEEFTGDLPESIEIAVW